MSKKIVITICGNSDASSFEMDLIKEKEKRSFPTPNVTANVNYDCACMRVCVCVCVYAVYKNVDRDEDRGI